MNSAVSKQKQSKGWPLKGFKEEMDFQDFHSRFRQTVSLVFDTLRETQVLTDPGHKCIALQSFSPGDRLGYSQSLCQ